MDEVTVFQAAKRCGIRWCPWMGDWFNSWSPRNGNENAEGAWHHWANLAAFILSHPATKEVAPELYRPDLKPNHGMYVDGNKLSDEQVKEFFASSESTP